SVRLRNRSSLSRSTCSACLRCTNCPICAPITWIACIRCSSGSRISVLLKARTPIIFPPEFTGNTNAPCIPASMAIAYCHTRATVCSSQSSCSARLRLVTRRARPRYPVKTPAPSNVGTPVLEKKCSAPLSSTSRTWKSLKGWRASSSLRCSSHVPLRGSSPSSQRVFPIIEETASAESPRTKAQVKRWLASCSQYQSPDNSAMARKRASLSPGPSLACFGAGRSLPFCLGRADCLMRAAIVDRPLQPVLTHHPVPPCALGATKGFVRGAYHQGRPDERIVALGCADAHGHRQRLFRSPCCAKA